MASVHFEMTASEQQAVAAFLSVKRAGDESARAIKKGYREAGEEVNKTTEKVNNYSKASKKGSEDSIQGLIKTAKQAAGVATAIALATKAWGIFGEEAKRNAEIAQKHFRELISTISASGNAASNKDIQAKLLGMSNTGVGLQQRAAIFNKVTGALPNTSVDTTLKITAQALRGRKAGLIGGDLETFAETMAQMHKLQPDLPLDQLADKAKVVSEAAGKHGTKLGGEGFGHINKLIQSKAMGVDEALGYGLAAMEAGIPLEKLASIVETAQNIKPVKPGTEKVRNAVVGSEIDTIQKRQQEIENREEELRRQENSDSIIRAERRRKEQEADLIEAEQSKNLNPIQKRIRDQKRKDRDLERKKIELKERDIDDARNIERIGMSEESFDLSRKLDELKPKEFDTVAKELTDADKLRNRLAEQSLPERVRSLLDINNLKTISPSNADEFAAILSANPQARIKSLAGSQGTLADTIGKMMSDKTTRDLFKIDSAVANTEDQILKKEGAKQREIAVREAEQEEEERYKNFGALSRFASSAARGAAKTFGAEAETVEQAGGFVGGLFDRIKRDLAEGPGPGEIRVRVVNQQTSVLQKNPLSGGTKDKDQFKPE